MVTDKVKYRFGELFIQERPELIEIAGSRDAGCLLYYISYLSALDAEFIYLSDREVMRKLQVGKSKVLSLLNQLKKRNFIDFGNSVIQDPENNEVYKRRWVTCDYENIQDAIDYYSLRKLEVNNKLKIDVSDIPVDKRKELLQNEALIKLFEMNKKGKL